MRLIIIAVLVVMFFCVLSIAHADRVDDINNMTPVGRCNVQSGMIVQGIYAYARNKTVLEHIGDRHSPEARTQQEQDYLIKYVSLGWTIADKYAKENVPNGRMKITQSWATAHGHMYNRTCLKSQGTTEGTKFLKVQSELLGLDFEWNSIIGCLNNRGIWYHRCVKETRQFSEAQIGEVIKHGGLPSYCDRRVKKQWTDCAGLYPKPTLSQEIEGEI